MDTDRPLFLHDDWDANENYRFEVRQKPKAIMMVRWLRWGIFPDLAFIRS